jgi:hypothetical protein
MAKKVIVTVLVIVACVLIYYWYSTRGDNARAGDGSVYPTDGRSASDDHTTVGPTPSRSDAPGTVNTASVAPGSVSNQPPPSMRSSTPSASMSNNGSTVPVSDTVAPNAPNGLAFGGTGKFQWYRQGNLTWRVDTASGTSCIAFATMDEWRKPIVYTHGCGNG